MQLKFYNSYYKILNIINDFLNSRPLASNLLSKFYNLINNKIFFVLIIILETLLYLKYQIL